MAYIFYVKDYTDNNHLLQSSIIKLVYIASNTVWNLTKIKIQHDTNMMFMFHGRF